MKTIRRLELALVLRSLLALIIASPSVLAQVPQRVYWVDLSQGTVERFNGASVQLLVSGLQGPFDIDLDTSAGKMYWTDDTGQAVQRANLDGSDLEDVVTSLPEPRAIKLDGAGKVYWSDSTADKIQRANLDGSGVEDLVTLVPPSSVGFMDIAGGRMYWTDAAAGKLQSANLDGTDVQDLVTVSSAAGIAVSGGRIYWAEQSPVNKIRSSNLDGTDVQDVVSGLSTPVGLAIDEVAGQLIWGAAGSGKIRRANLDGTGVEDLTTPGTSIRGVAIEPSHALPVPALPASGLLVLAGAMLLMGIWKLKARTNSFAGARNVPGGSGPVRFPWRDRD